MNNNGELGLGDTNSHPTPVAMCPSVHNITKGKDYCTIQTAVDDANDNINNTIVIDEGRYSENISVPSSKKLLIRSSDPNNPSVVAATIVDGCGFSKTFNFSGNAGSTISGLSIYNDYDYGIYAYNSGVAVSNCLINGGSIGTGVGSSGTSSNITIRNCRIENCSYGVYTSSPASLLICNNTISGSLAIGIYLYPVNGSSPQIYDNMICRNGSYGLNIVNSNNAAVTVRNNTIAYNTYYGVCLSSNIASTAISNCIIWKNNKSGSTYGSQLNVTNANVTWSDVWQASGTYSGTGNQNTDPLFVTPDANDFHIKFNSPCIDAGDPNFNPAGEIDIDGEGRKFDGNRDGTAKVDMGADEYWDNGDYNHDSIVNFKDYAKLAKYWMQSSYLYDLSGDGTINWVDLGTFSDFWLTAGTSYGGDQMQGDGLDEGLELDSGETLLDEGEPLGGLKLTVNGDTDPNEPVVLEPNETVSIGIWGDGSWMFYYGYIGLEIGANASLDTTFADLIYQGNVSGINMTDEPEWAELLEIENPFIFAELIDLAVPPDGPLPLDGQLIDDITFTGTGTLLLFDGEGNFLDSVTFTSSE